MRTQNLVLVVATVLVMSGVLANGFASFVTDHTVTQCASDVATACE